MALIVIITLNFVAGFQLYVAELVRCCAVLFVKFVINTCLQDVSVTEKGAILTRKVDAFSFLTGHVQEAAVCINGCAPNTFMKRVSVLITDALCTRRRFWLIRSGGGNLRACIVFANLILGAFHYFELAVDALVERLPIQTRALIAFRLRSAGRLVLWLDDIRVDIVVWWTVSAAIVVTACGGDEYGSHQQKKWMFFLYCHHVSNRKSLHKKQIPLDFT